MTAQRGHVGDRVQMKVLSVQGTCDRNHRAGDTFEIRCHPSGGRCGFFHEHTFPWISMLRFAGGFPPDCDDRDRMQVECMDRWNTVAPGLPGLPSGVQA